MSKAVELKFLPGERAVITDMEDLPCVVRNALLHEGGLIIYTVTYFLDGKRHCIDVHGDELKEPS